MRIITISDAEKFRTPGELDAWVDRKCRIFSATRVGRRAVRLNKHRSAKWLMEEIFPLSRFARVRFAGREDVALRPLRGNQPYDAEIRSAADLLYRRMEITHSGLNRDEHLRMVFLEKHGHVPMTGSVSSTRDRFGKEVVEAELEARSHTSLRDEMLADVLERVRMKSKKRYGPDVALLVAFSPLGKPLKDDQEAYAAFARSELREFASRFPDIFLVSTFGDYVSSVAELCSDA